MTTSCLKNSWNNFIRFSKNFWKFLCKSYCRVTGKQRWCCLFYFNCIVFVCVCVFVCLFLWPGPLIQCQTKIIREDLAFFLTLGKRLSIFFSLNVMYAVGWTFAVAFHQIEKIPLYVQFSEKYHCDWEFNYFLECVSVSDEKIVRLFSNIQLIWLSNLTFNC